ncbi:DUF2793 domain-containing protein [Ectopseudomonas composti]|uniref:DUF2793 domain-containing protein n=1 Tax=Ectopseudomonas composti TaxID=658457 RepID=UPI000773DD31|nr:DUF2793 domain-containing protein [Pseudomonas composti]
MSTAKNQLQETANGQSNYLNVNKALAQIDQLVHQRVIDKDLATPPGSPANGAAYIVAAGATGAWSGKSGQIAFYLTAEGAWSFLVPGANDRWRVWVSDEAKDYRWNGSAWVIDSAASGESQSIIIACSDETTAITAGAGKVTFRMPYAFTLTSVRASLSTPQTGGSIVTIDINEGGTSILSTKLTIDNTEKTSTTAATAAVISDSSLADDAEITIDVDQIGDGTAKGLKVALIGTPT